jgi:acetyl-CoA carboxylase biotin carboxyl carrier protein
MRVGMEGRPFLATPVTSPMEGRVLSVGKTVGDQVEEDEVVIVLEAMKMEIPVVAPVGGILREMNVKPGDTVESDSVLAVID